MRITEPGFYWVNINGAWTTVQAVFDEGFLEVMIFFVGSTTPEKANYFHFQDIRKIEDPDTEDLNRKVENEHSDAR